jgi:RimJ/RimL family protein N-acetyltransferase
MSIFRINWIDRTATTGAMIGNKKYWNNGYGTEAKMLLLKYAFETLGLRKIHSLAFAYNERSVNYSLKCGYKIIGRQKDEKFKFGKYHDVIMLEVFQDQWRAAYDIWSKTQNKKHTLKK